MKRVIGAALATLLFSKVALGQAPLAEPMPPPGYASGYAPAYAPPQYGYGVATSSRTRTQTEMAWLYATSVLYGVGLGVWFGAELDIEDPALFLIAPAVLGIAAPAAVYAIDHPPLRRGVPAAIAAGAVIGAGEGIGIASLQFVTQDKEDAWGFRGLSRATVVGATLGAAGGAVLGFLQQPSPKSSLLMTSGVAWGSAIGAMFGYGASEEGIGYGRANDDAALGGLIGYNVGLVATAALSTVYVPSYKTLGWMWTGAGIGFAASLPVYLFYAGEGGPPAKRGLVFSATATTLGLAAGALFTARARDEASLDNVVVARLTMLAPWVQSSTVGFMATGEVF